MTKKVFTTSHDAPSGTIARGVCFLCVLKSEAGLHIRLPAEEVLASGWEMVPEVHGLLLQQLDAVFCGHGTIELRVLKDRIG